MSSNLSVQAPLSSAFAAHVASIETNNPKICCHGVRNYVPNTLGAGLAIKNKQSLAATLVRVMKADCLRKIQHTHGR